MPSLRFATTVLGSTDSTPSTVILDPEILSLGSSQTELVPPDLEQVEQIKDLQRRRSERRRKHLTPFDGEDLVAGGLIVPKHKLSRDGIHYVSPYPSPAFPILSSAEQRFTALHKDTGGDQEDDDDDADETDVEQSDSDADTETGADEQQLRETADEASCPVVQTGLVKESDASALNQTERNNAGAIPSSLAVENVERDTIKPELEELKLKKTSAQ